MYYCEIPWDQIWNDFNEWFNGADTTSQPPTWEQQRQAFQKIAKEVIPFRIRWKKTIWEPFSAWYDNKEPPWNEQRKKIQKLVQAEADYSVNQ
jgi:hypothetical protein